jgi:hypothetical protein
MNWQDIDVLKVYVMISPLVVLAIGLGVYRLTGWLDRREEQRHHAAE